MTVAPQIDMELLTALVNNPDWIEQELAERSLAEFIRQMWKWIDPSPYVGNWHIDAIAEHLEAVNRGEIHRLIINIPPRHMKSIAVSVAWPAWTWTQQATTPLRGPAVRFLFASYAQSLSIRDSVKCRRVIDSPLYQARWGDRFKWVGDQNTKIRFDNDKKGYRLATSVDGALTGEGGDVIVVDDPHNVTEAESVTVRQAALDWWDESMSNRLNDAQTGAYVVIMQRVHAKDFTGHLLDKGGWEHLCLPTRYERDHPHVSIHDMRTENDALLWPQRFPEEVVAQQQVDMGSYGFAGQNQQRPAPRTGSLFDKHWWGVVDAVPAGGRMVRAWDLAATAGAGDWTVGGLVKHLDGIFYVMDVQRAQLSPYGVEKMIRNLAEHDGRHVEIDIPQDPAQAGKSQVATFVKLLVGYIVRWSTEKGDKEDRARQVSPQVEAGNFKLLRGDWNTDFINEFHGFPKHGPDDQVDMLSRAFERLIGKQKRRPRVGGATSVEIPE